jgi:hypothetical protein
MIDVVQGHFYINGVCRELSVGVSNSNPVDAIMRQDSTDIFVHGSHEHAMYCMVA